MIRRLLCVNRRLLTSQSRAERGWEGSRDRATRKPTFLINTYGNSLALLSYEVTGTTGGRRYLPSCWSPRSRPPPFLSVGCVSIQSDLLGLRRPSSLGLGSLAGLKEGRACFSLLLFRPSARHSVCLSVSSRLSDTTLSVCRCLSEGGSESFPLSSRLQTNNALVRCSCSVLTEPCPCPGP